jgi:di/tricarboxylate transporter
MMWLSLLALAATVGLGIFSRFHAGVLALSFAWVLGEFQGLPAAAITGMFPLRLFLLLFGITFFFEAARHNGTLDRLAHAFLGLFRQQPRWTPLGVFLAAAVFSAAGPGNIATTALLAPLVLKSAATGGFNLFGISLLLVLGANAGAFSPLAPTGVIAQTLTDDLRLGLDPWRHIFWPPFLAQSLVALVVLTLEWRRAAAPAAAPALSNGPWTGAQKLTLAAMGLLIGGVAFFRWDSGMWALVLSSALMAAGAISPKAVFPRQPWDVILLVCGMGTLIALLESTGGLDGLARLVSRVSTPRTLPLVLGFFAGLFSSVSSSSGVVLPTLLPLIPHWAAPADAVQTLRLASTINVASHLVDAGPFSTMGALCMAAAAPWVRGPRLFHQLLIFSFSMTVAGAFLCWALF